MYVGAQKMRGRGKKVESARHDILHEHNSSPGVTMLQQVIKMRGITSVRERSNRSWFSCGLVLLILAAVSPTCSRTSSASETTNKQPNIIWLVLDDASPTLRCYGDAQAITPSMDRLAREGARFTRAFSHAPVCAPS